MSLTDPAWPQQPVPVQSLGYSTPAEHARPGIVTAIGVICIIVGCLSGLSSFMGGIYSIGLYFASQMQARMTTASAATYSVATAAVPATSPGASPALQGGDAAVAVNALNSMLSLDNAHLVELDRLMRHHGREVFGGEDDTRLTAASVRDAVIKSKRLSRSSGKAQFSTAQGTVEIFPDHAVFTSADHSTTVNTSARNSRDLVTNSAAANATTNTAVVGGTPASTTLTAAQVDQVVAAAKAFGTPISKVQLQSLRAELARPDQVLVAPAAPALVTSVFAQPNGNVSFYFNTGNMLILDPQGKVLLSGAMPMPNFNVSGLLATVNGVEALASIALAVYLLIVGILVLRGSFSSPRLLRTYAWIKIPLAIVAGIGLPMLAYDVSRAVTSSPALGLSATPASVEPGYIIAGAVSVLLGLALPIGLLIALRTRTVRDFYNSMAPSR